MAKAAVVQCEITGQDGAAPRRFYASLFGWHMDATPRPDFHFAALLTRFVERLNQR